MCIHAYNTHVHRTTARAGVLRALLPLMDGSVPRVWTAVQGGLAEPVRSHIRRGGGSGGSGDCFDCQSVTLWWWYTANTASIEDCAQGGACIRVRMHVCTEDIHTLLAPPLTPCAHSHGHPSLIGGEWCRSEAYAHIEVLERGVQVDVLAPLHRWQEGLAVARVCCGQHMCVFM